MTLLSVLFVGFLLGMKHATEADHLAAVATLATRRGGTWVDAMRQGAAWGLGHTATLLVFGGIALALGQAIPTRFEQMLELGVGFMLILLGLDVLRRLRQQRIHFHAHEHDDGVTHIHAHSHAAELERAKTVPEFSQLGFALVADPGHRQEMHQHPHVAPVLGRALLVGMMHGMAGSAALVVLSLGAVPSVTMGALYILLFGAGSILGMALLSMAIAVPLRLSGSVLTGLHQGVTVTVGAFSCGLGLWVIYRVGIAEGLLLG